MHPFRHPDLLFMIKDRIPGGGMKQINHSFILFYLVLVVFCSVLFLPSHTMATSEDKPLGRKMAQQATKSKKRWNTTDHTKHKALNQVFTSGTEITRACLSCHSEAADQFHKTIHWTWIDPNSTGDSITGKAGHSLNNFCISTNNMKDTSCADCHPGWNGKSGDINCLECHGQKSINFKEALEDFNAFNTSKDAEDKELALEIQGEIKVAVQAIGRPTRKNCGGCHFKGGGGDGVKHGDLDTSLTKPNKALDVHMGHDGQNFECVRCHTTVLHNIAGRIYSTPAAADRRSLIEDDLTAKIMCESCHTSKPHTSGSKPNDHTDKVACQSCHISKFARVNPTKMSWDWSKAGKKKNGKPYKEKGPLGKHNYLSIKGKMKWAKNVTPEYFWFNGSINTLTVKDVIDPGKVVKVSWPEGSQEDKNARIFPFKVHRGKQPYDKEHKTLLAPLLSGKKGYWTTLNWDESLKVGSDLMDLPFSGQFDFVETTYVFPTTHMVSPKDETLACTECHVRENSRLASLAGFYMPGRDSFKLIDYGGWAIVIAALIGVILHALGRIISINNKSEG